MSDTPHVSSSSSPHFIWAFGLSPLSPFSTTRRRQQGCPHHTLSPPSLCPMLRLLSLHPPRVMRCVVLVDLDAARADRRLHRRLFIGRYTPRMKARQLRWLV